MIDVKNRINSKLISGGNKSFQSLCIVKQILRVKLQKYDIQSVNSSWPIVFILTGGELSVENHFSSWPVNLTMALARTSVLVPTKANLINYGHQLALEQFHTWINKALKGQIWWGFNVDLLHVLTWHHKVKETEKNTLKQLKPVQLKLAIVLTLEHLHPVYPQIQHWYNPTFFILYTAVSPNTCIFT